MSQFAAVKKNVWLAGQALLAFRDGTDEDLREIGAMMIAECIFVVVQANTVPKGKRRNK